MIPYGPLITFFFFRKQTAMLLERTGQPQWRYGGYKRYGEPLWLATNENLTLSRPDPVSTPKLTIPSSKDPCLSATAS